MSDLASETQASDPNGLRCALFPNSRKICLKKRVLGPDRLRDAMLIRPSRLIGYLLLLTSPRRQADATLTIVSSAVAINATVMAWNASIGSIRAIPGIVWSLGMDPLPPQLYARHASDNALGLANREGKALIILNLDSTWSHAADDDVVDKAAKSLIVTIKQAVSELDALDPFVYINYAAPWQRPFEGYGAASLDRLRRVQRRYDPDRVFTDLVPGGFKVPA